MGPGFSGEAPSDPFKALWNVEVFSHMRRKQFVLGPSRRISAFFESKSSSRRSTSTHASDGGTSGRCDPMLVRGGDELDQHSPMILH